MLSRLGRRLRELDFISGYGRNTSKAEAAPTCVFQALKLDLGLPGTKAFAARISGLGTAWSSRFVETRAKRV